MHAPNPCRPSCASMPPVRRDPRPVPLVHQARLHYVTAGALDFIDITDAAQAAIAASVARHGVAVVQSLHTTAALIVNEAEPLLLEDLRAALARFAPCDVPYRHDDFSRRTVNMTPDEQPNGFAHCRALVLPSSVTLAVQGGRLCLGRWQRVFLVELDRSRERTVVVTVLGA